MSRSRYFGLDIVRATTLCIVLSAHFVTAAATITGFTVSPALAMAGVMSVEMFFALSGFLIGSLLMEIVERGPGFSSWWSFMMRRWLRTLPAYFVWLVILIVLIPPLRENTLRRYAFFSQNLFWPMPPDNWFSVSWSLALEEWFYLGFSALLIVIALKRPRIAIPVACVVFMIFPLLLRYVYTVDLTASDVDFGIRKITAFRLDATAYGVLMAWLFFGFRKSFEKVRISLAAVSILVLLLIFFGSAESWPRYVRPLVFSIIPLALAGCLPVLVAIPDIQGLAGRLFRGLSDRSYSLYIVHLSIVEVTLVNVAPRFAIPTYIGLSFLVGELLFRFIERPFMRWRSPQRFSFRPAAESIPSGMPVASSAS